MVQTGMKIDGRTLTREMLVAMRFLALDRMAEGESPVAISASFGMHRTWAYKVRLKARGRGKRSVRLRKAPSRPRTLTEAQERHGFRWVNGKDRLRLPSSPVRCSGPPGAAFRCGLRAAP